MLEPLVSSKVRRALFEYLLSHQDDRFYLSGLARELGVTISPLRRELKRLEQLGMLKAVQEANIRFYRIDQTCPLFVRLSGVWSQIPRFPAQDSSDPTLHVAQAQEGPPVILSATPEVNQRLTGREPAQAGRRRFPLSWSPAMAVLSLGVITVLLGMGGLAYFAVTNQQLHLLEQQVATMPPSQVTVVERGAQVRSLTSAQMQSANWRFVPGGLGTFSPPTDDGGY